MILETIYEICYVQTIYKHTIYVFVLLQTIRCFSYSPPPTLSSLAVLTRYSAVLQWQYKPWRRPSPISNAAMPSLNNSRLYHLQSSTQQRRGQRSITAAPFRNKGRSYSPLILLHFTFFTTHLRLAIQASPLAFIYTRLKPTMQSIAANNPSSLHDPSCLCQVGCFSIDF